MKITLTNPLWRYTGAKASWYFITIDGPYADKLKFEGRKGKGWRQVKVRAKIGNTEWETSAFPDKERGYVIPVKKSVRQAEQLKENEPIKLTLILI